MYPCVCLAVSFLVSTSRISLRQAKVRMRRQQWTALDRPGHNTRYLLPIPELSEPRLILPEPEVPDPKFR